MPHSGAAEVGVQPDATKLLALLRADRTGREFSKEIQRRVREHAIMNNRLSDDIIYHGYIRVAHLAHKLREQRVPEVDISRFYSSYCLNRSRPMIAALSNVGVGSRLIGMNIELESDEFIGRGLGTVRGRTRSLSPPPRDVPRSGASSAHRVACHSPVALPPWSIPGTAPLTDTRANHLVCGLRVKYISFFVEGWGGWFVPIGESPNPVDIAAIIDFLDIAAGCGLQLVTLDITDRVAFRYLVATLMQQRGSADEFRCPMCVEIGRVNPEDRVVSLGMMSAQYLGLDTLSWLDRNDLIRLSESPPMNPIGYSLCQRWQLRAEQMAYICLRAAVALSIARSSATM